MHKPRSTSFTARSLILIGLAALSVVNWSCAKKGFPEGGPLDKTPPDILSTVPASGAVSVPQTAELQIGFSEPIDRKTLLPNLSISPTLNGQPEIKWSKRAAHVRWDDTLRADITYRVSIGLKLADVHKNTLKDAYTLAFSTGAQIDTGQIIGHIFTGQSAASGLEVLAYRLDSADTWLPIADTLGGIAPDFVSQTGAEGGFDLLYLPPARFRVIALADRNRNRIPDPNETIGIPSRDADLASGFAPPPLRIFTQVYDTTSFAIKSCTSGEDGSILIGLSHPADTALWRGAPFVVIDSASGDAVPVEILRPVPPRFTVVPVASAEFTASHSYVIKSVALQPPARDARGVALSESQCTLAYPSVTDTSGVRITWTILPDSAHALTPRWPVMIGFSETVDTIGGSQLLHVYDTIGTAIGGMIVWADARQVEFHPASAWPETTEVVVALDSALLRDRHGNPPPSQTWTWRFTPLTESRMGAISCRVKVSDSALAVHRCRIEAFPKGRDAVVRADVKPNELFDIPLPSGPWILSAYLDLNGDGRFSPGSLMPYAPAEPRVIRADTIEVRERFTNEDIEISF